MLLASLDTEGRFFAASVLHRWPALAVAASVLVPERGALLRWGDVLYSREARAVGRFFRHAHLGSSG
ncbi:hypothetical protein D9M68_963620 [compost metagenome]